MKAFMPRLKVIVSVRSPSSNEAPVFSVASLSAVLRGRGLRITRNREALLAVLVEAETPLSLKDLLQRAQARGASPDPVTVFRLMTMLETQRIVRRLHLGSTASHYELNDPQRQHEHLICRDCGQVRLIEDRDRIRKLEQEIARLSGFTDLTHTLEFFGRCADCAPA